MGAGGVAAGSMTKGGVVDGSAAAWRHRLDPDAAGR
jgi:hypothetical protein